MTAARPSIADSSVLDTLPLFATLSADTRRHLLAASAVREYASGSTLFTADAAGNAQFTIGMTQGELAEELGTAREVIVRGLTQLKRDGIIAATGRGQLRVSDPVRLRDAAARWAHGS